MSASPTPARRLLITAGPTQEPIDSVRYLANRSSGRMGIALAEAAISLGMPTTLLLGPTSHTPPKDSQPTTMRFQTTTDLQRLLTTQWPRHDVLLMAAAVADYRPTQPPPPAVKLPRRDDPWRLDLEPTPDLLAALAATTRPDQTIIGFALDPADRLTQTARRKLAAKGIDAIVANPLETMDSDRISATVLLSDGRTLTPPQAGLSKRDFADWLLGQLETIIAAARTHRA